MSKKLATLRKQIDSLDQNILELINKRVKIAEQVQSEKKVKSTDIFDPARESAILTALNKQNETLPKKALERIFHEIFSVSRSIAADLKIAYLGPEFSYSYLAAADRFGSQANYIPKRSILDVFEEVEEGRSDYGVVPIENNFEGVVTDSLTSFLHTDLTILGELYEPIEHVLASKHKMKEIKKVFSHPQALAQCRNWIRNHLSRAEVVESGSTSQAAERASLYRHSAAIASEPAALKHGLNILKKGIQDNKKNTTRFLVIGSKVPEKKKHNKTLIVFSTKHEAGSLYKALGSLQKNKINMTMIESKRNPSSPWEYLFFIDLEGHQEESRVKKALDELKKTTTLLKVLGSYPVAKL